MDDQRALALNHANDIRIASAQLKARIRAAGPRGGAQLAAEVVINADLPIRFYRLLVAIPGVGEVQARKLLARAQLNPEARVCDPIGSRRRNVLAGLLVNHAKGSRRR